MLLCGADRQTEECCPQASVLQNFLFRLRVAYESFIFTLLEAKTSPWVKQGVASGKARILYHTCNSFHPAGMSLGTVASSVCGVGLSW